MFNEIWMIEKLIQDAFVLKLEFVHTQNQRLLYET